MWAVVVVGLLVGLDNLQVGAALGLAGLSSRRRRLAAVAFALCETLMPLVGLALGHGARRVAGDFAEWIGIGALVICGALILWTSRRGGSEDEAASILDRDVTLVLLPLSLSFDNLLAGLSFGALGFPVLPTALGIGFLSGALCAVGLYGGDRAHRLVPPWAKGAAEAASGGFLLLLAGVRMVEVLSGAPT